MIWGYPYFWKHPCHWVVYPPGNDHRHPLQSFPALLSQWLNDRTSRERWDMWSFPWGWIQNVNIFTNNMVVSKNRGTPKSSILIGFSIINHPFWGTTIFGNIHMFFLWKFWNWPPGLVNEREEGPVHNILIQMKASKNPKWVFPWPLLVPRLRIPQEITIASCFKKRNH